MARLPQLVARLKQRGIYTIARVVLFKDNPLASTRPDLALRRRDGSIFRDREGLACASQGDTGLLHSRGAAPSCARPSAEVLSDAEGSDG